MRSISACVFLTMEIAVFACADTSVRSINVRLTGRSGGKLISSSVVPLDRSTVGDGGVSFACEGAVIDTAASKARYVVFFMARFLLMPPWAYLQ